MPSCCARVLEMRELADGYAYRLAPEAGHCQRRASGAPISHSRSIAIRESPPASQASPS